MSDAVRLEVEVFTRGLLAARMEQLTEEQLTFFNDRAFPEGVQEEDLIGAIDLCDRTIKRNILKGDER